MTKNNEGPIGIFDSGIGGLTVYKALAKLMPGEDMVYLGDTARVPYGTKSRETVVRYALEDAEFLVAHDIKLLVVACNTASAYALGELQARVKVPVIGVIDPGARAAIEATRTNRIGIIGTEATIASGVYSKKLRELRPEVELIAQPCPLFVPLAEEGWAETHIAHEAALKYLGKMKRYRIDTMVLGCTHYPIMKRTISMAMGFGVTLIDSAEATAVEVKELLGGGASSDKGGNGDKGDKGSAGTHRFFVTDSPERFKSVSETFLGRALDEVELCSL
jgi:glutamate racemase